jgi:RHS repeat-associated protein
VIESRSYTAFGDELTSSGTGARTSYIGRETDNESDLGFYGVRMYDPTYGRFLSTDPLWSKYLPLQSYQYCRNSPVMRTDRTGMADFFDEVGQKVGSDGVNDGTKFIANAAVYNAALVNQTSWEMMGGVQGVYQLPSASALNAIEASCLNPASSSVGDRSRREYGGVIGSGGDFFEAAPGPIATGVSQGPEIDLAGAFGKAREAGQSIMATVHTHVNFSIKSNGAQVQGNESPSKDDRAMLGPTMYPYGMVIWPRNDSFTQVTFFGRKKANDEGVKTDVRIGWSVLKGIVEDSGSKK